MNELAAGVARRNVVREPFSSASPMISSCWASEPNVELMAYMASVFSGVRSTSSLTSAGLNRLSVPNALRINAALWRDSSAEALAVARRCCGSVRMPVSD